MVTVLKLGGSVITEKDEEERVDRANLDAAADAIAAFEGPIVLVHGGGSFGHPAASAHDVTTTKGSRDAEAGRAIHAAMHRLNTVVLTALAERRVPVLPVHPLSVASRDSAGDLSLPTGQVETMLETQFVPVLHGDVVAHAGAGVTVLSGDELVVTIAEAVNADRVGLCSEVSGVLDADGEVIERVTALDDVADTLDGSEATDVTGGMAGKIRELLALSTPASVFGLDDLSAFLGGKRPGTLIE